MLNYDSIEKNKNKIINFCVIILALVIAFKFYKSANDQVGSIIQQQNNELEKNKVIEDIVTLEKKAEVYKKLLVKKDFASIMDMISGIAKNTSVKIVSVKPYAEERFDNYFSYSFSITLNVPSYHVLGDFISKIENYKDIYLISEISINSIASNAVVAGANAALVVNLKINTIAYL